MLVTQRLHFFDPLKTRNSMIGMFQQPKIKRMIYAIETKMHVKLIESRYSN